MQKDDDDIRGLQGKGALRPAGEILRGTEQLIGQGTAGIVYGRNVIQHANPAGHDASPDVDGAEERIIKTSNTGQPLTENVLACLDLESRFYAVLSKAASSGLASNPRRSKSREPKRPKGRESVFNKQKGSKWAFLRLAGT